MPGKSKSRKGKVRFPCGKCRKECESECLLCEVCNKWLHGDCEGLSKADFKKWSTIQGAYICTKCIDVDDFDYLRGMTRLQRVDNIPPLTTSSELRDAFGDHDTVGDVYIPADRYNPRYNRGFAFVRYIHEDDARDAIKEMDGYVMDGMTLGVQLARHPRSPPRYGGYRPVNWPRPRDRSRGRDRSRDMRRDSSRGRSRSHATDRSRSPDSENRENVIRRSRNRTRGNKSRSRCRCLSCESCWGSRSPIRSSSYSTSYSETSGSRSRSRSRSVSMARSSHYGDRMLKEQLRRWRQRPQMRSRSRSPTPSWLRLNRQSRGRSNSPHTERLRARRELAYLKKRRERRSNSPVTSDSDSDQRSRSRSMSRSPYGDRRLHEQLRGWRRRRPMRSRSRSPIRRWRGRSNSPSTERQWDRRALYYLRRTRERHSRSPVTSDTDSDHSHGGSDRSKQSGTNMDTN